MAFKRNDSPLYFITAREAAAIERAGDYGRAAKVWAKANRASRNPDNQKWSSVRCDFCMTQHIRQGANQ